MLVSILINLGHFFAFPQSPFWLDRSGQIMSRLHFRCVDVPYCLETQTNMPLTGVRITPVQYHFCHTWGRQFIFMPFTFSSSSFIISCFLSPQGPEQGFGGGQGEASSASAPPALVQPRAERGAGWSPSMDQTACHPTGNRHTGIATNHSLWTFLFSFPVTVCLMRCCLSQGCVSCSSGAGMSHPTHPAAPDSSSPLESPQHDPIGLVVDTWELWPEITHHQVYSVPALSGTSTTLTVHLFWPVWRSGSLCFSVKSNMFNKGSRGWTRP